MKKLLHTTAISLLTAVAFDNAGGWKTDEDGKIEMKDGNPIFVDSSGAEKTVGGDTITKLNGEAKSHREAKEAAETKLKTFEGIDPDKARDAIEMVGKLDAKTLIDAGEVDKVRDEMKGQFTEQLGEKDGKIAELQAKNNDMVIDHIFNSSEFVRENINVPQDMFQDSFRKNFKVEDGQVKVYGKDGNQIMSKEKAGEYASPEEALTILVDSHPQKDVILKASSEKGSGGSSSGGTRGGQRSVSRTELDKMTPAEQAEIAGKAATGEINITD